MEVQCLLQATPQQRQILEENCGWKDPENVAQVKVLYEALDLQSAFFKYEEDSYSRLKRESPRSVLCASVPSIFLEPANKIYKRRK